MKSHVYVLPSTYVIGKNKPKPKPKLIMGWPNGMNKNDDQYEIIEVDNFQAHESYNFVDDYDSQHANERSEDSNLVCSEEKDTIESNSKKLVPVSNKFELSTFQEDDQQPILNKVDISIHGNKDIPSPSNNDSSFMTSPSVAENDLFNGSLTKYGNDSVRVRKIKNLWKGHTSYFERLLYGVMVKASCYGSFGKHMRKSYQKLGVNLTSI